MENTNSGVQVMKGIIAQVITYQLMRLVCSKCHKDGDVATKEGIFCHSCYKDYINNKDNKQG